MAAVVRHAPGRFYLLHLGDGKSILVDEKGFAGRATAPVVLRVSRCWLDRFLFRPLWQWDVSTVRQLENPPEVIQGILQRVVDALAGCNTIAEVVTQCERLSQEGGRGPTQARATPEEVVFDLLDSVSRNFLVLVQRHFPRWSVPTRTRALVGNELRFVQRHYPRWLEAICAWFPTNAHDELDWTRRNRAPLFEVAAYLFYIVDFTLYNMRQSEQAHASTQYHCAVGIAKRLLPRATPTQEQVENVSKMVFGRVQRYHELPRKSQSAVPFEAALEVFSPLWNQIRSAARDAKVSPGFSPIIIDGDIEGVMRMPQMVNEVRDLVVGFFTNLVRAMEGCDDYRTKGTARLLDVLTVPQHLAPRGIQLVAEAARRPRTRPSPSLPPTIAHSTH